MSELEDVLHAHEDALAARAAADPQTIASLERALSHPIPPDLRAALLVADGVTGEYGLGLLWPAERIARENRMMRGTEEFRDLYMSFDSLVFFGDAGNGDLFGLPTYGGRPDVFVWDHESDSRTWVANSIADYLERWLAGTLTV